MRMVVGLDITVILPIGDHYLNHRKENEYGRYLCSYIFFRNISVYGLDILVIVEIERMFRRMLKCKDCRIFTFRSLCYADDKQGEACHSNGDETQCELFPERRKIAQEKKEAELFRRISAKWIDFDKQKPVHGDSVLGIDTEGNIEVYQYSEEWQSCLMKYDGILKAFNITHWMPLPKAPENKKF